MGERLPTWPFWCVAGLTYGLVLLGGVVTGSGSGLGCGPMWPVCLGHVFPGANIHADIEWTHRLLAGGVGLSVLGIAGWTVRATRSRRQRALALAAVALVLVQVALGAIVVLEGLPPAVVAVHDVVATILLIVVVTAALLANRPRQTVHLDGRTVLLWGACAIALVTVFLGSYLAHLDLAVSGFVNAIATLGSGGGRMTVGPGWWHWGAAGLLAVMVMAAIGSIRPWPRSAWTWMMLVVAGLSAQAGLGVVLLATRLAGLALVLHEGLGVGIAASLAATAVRVSTEQSAGRTEGSFEAVAIRPSAGQ